MVRLNNSLDFNFNYAINQNNIKEKWKIIIENFQGQKQVFVKLENQSMWNLLDIPCQNQKFKVCYSRNNLYKDLDAKLFIKSMIKDKRKNTYGHRKFNNC